MASVRSVAQGIWKFVVFVSVLALGELRPNSGGARSGTFCKCGARNALLLFAVSAIIPVA